MSEEWGPWVLHDGGGCPCVGQYVHRVYRGLGRNPDGSWSGESFGLAKGTGSWTWEAGWNPIIRYRIRKPRGMTILEGLLENLPATVEGVDA